MRRTAVALIACVAGSLLGGCGGLSEGEGPATSSTTSPVLTTSAVPDTTATSATPPPGPVISGDLDVIALPVEGRLPADLLVQCPSGPAFPFGALTNIPGLDDADPDGYLDAIAPFLANEEGQHWPQEGWRLLESGEGEATLVAPTEDGSLAYMYLTGGDGNWEWSGSSINGNPCDLQYTVPEGLHTVEWELDPEGLELTAGTTELHVLLTERECASGLEIGDRLLGPQVVMTEDSVHIAFAAQPPEGEFQTCPGIAPAPFVVELPVPLGDREIVPKMNIRHSLEDYLD